MRRREATVNVCIPVTADRGLESPVSGCLDAFARNEVEEISPGGACGRHEHGHGGGQALPTRG